MPEGPELHLSSRFISRVCSGRIFGRVLKSEISKNPPVEPPSERFTISASSRGKEIKLILTEVSDIKDNLKKELVGFAQKSLHVLFTFGLAGKFDFYEAKDGLKKHAHMNFFTDDQGTEMVLSFVDYMRFGKWTPGADFSYKERGPCVLYEYPSFRENVLKSLSCSAFNKPICEVLLNQKYFNGIGNYLRAEVLYRCKVPPFVCARSVLEPLMDVDSDSHVVKSESPDILELCNILPLEVVQLEDSWYNGSNRNDSSNGFNIWLQCYYQDGMKNLSDHNKRTIWYTGPLGPMVPKDGVTKAKKKSRSKSTEKSKNNTQDHTSKVSGKRKKEETTRAKGTGKKVKKEEEKPEPCLGKVDDTPAYTAVSTDLILSETFQTTRLTRGKMRKVLEDKSVPAKLKVKRKETKKEQCYDGINGYVDSTQSNANTTIGKVRQYKSGTPLNNSASYLKSSHHVSKMIGKRSKKERQSQSKRLRSVRLK